jgi:GNAT superfamily N-acetyltransferase
MGFAGVVGIERFEAGGDAQQAAACYEIFHATRVADDPDVPVMPRGVFEGWLKTGWVGDPRETWLMAAEDGVAGWYLLELPVRDNTHLGILDVMVPPDRQRRGLGTALLRHAAGRALADGRSLLTGYACAGSAGEAFAGSFGATGGLAEIHRVLDLDTVAAGPLAELRAEAQRAAAGYSLISWVSPTPEEYVDQVAAISGLMYDAPHDPSVEAWIWDAARVRDSERRMRLQGVRAHIVAARHDASGELGGFTQVEVGPEQPDRGFQALTAVVRVHRGHRLGLLLKLAMMELLAEVEPQVRQLFTSNAETNEHMIAVNERLGYRVLGKPARSWELPAAEAIGRIQP